MKKAFALCALGIMLATPALADKPGADWMTIDQIAAKLKTAGYTNISEIEADDGAWEAVADKDGKTVKLKLDSKTGEVLKTKPKKDDDDDD